MHAGLRFLNKNALRRLILTVAPIVLMFAAVPFAGREGPQANIARAVGDGVALSALGLPVLFLLFAVMRPDGWSPRQAVETAQTITLWLAASAVISCVF